jgi:hypothetical protein
MGMSLLGESEIQTTVYCKENGITASIIPSKLASCPIDSLNSLRRNRPSGEARGRERTSWYGEAKQQSMAADFAANYRVNF